MEKNWFYSADGQEKKGPVPESELQQLLASGQVAAGTLVWSEGMANWAPASTVAALQQPAAVVTAGTPAVAAPVAAAPVTGGVAVPQGIGGWMTFVAIMNIIGGAGCCLLCIYIPLGIPMIISGVTLLGAKSLLTSLPSVDPTMLPFLLKLRTAFKAMGWIHIAGFIMMIIIFVIYGAVIFAAVSGAARMH